MSDNTLASFQCEIDNLCYTTVEGEISRYYDMGSPDSSGFPPILPDNYMGNIYSLSCSRKYGEFYVSIYKLLNGKYQLSVYPKGKLYCV